MVVGKKINKKGGGNMGKRITIVLDDDIDKKLRLKQAKLIQKENRSVSFSSVINSMLRRVV